MFTAAGMTVRHEAIPGLGHAFPTGRDRAVLAAALAWALDALPAKEQPGTNTAREPSKGRGR